METQFGLQSSYYTKQNNINTLKKIPNGKTVWENLKKIVKYLSMVYVL